MNRLVRNGMTLVCSVFLFSCSSKKEKINWRVLPQLPPAPQKSISIRFIDVVEFRRSFAFIQSTMLNEKEIEKEMEEAERSNPISVEESKEFRKMLEPFGFVKGRELLLHKFRYTTKSENQLTDSSGNLVKIKFIHDPGTATKTESWSISASNKNDSAWIKINMHPWELKYALLDIIPGGYKEIVVLEEWYIANGYNFDFHAYEINTR